MGDRDRGLEIFEKEKIFDGRFIDGAVNGTARAIREAGSRARLLESGRVQTYQRLILGAVVLLMIFVVVKGA